METDKNKQWRVKAIIFLSICGIGLAFSTAINALNYELAFCTLMLIASNTIRMNVESQYIVDKLKEDGE